MVGSSNPDFSEEIYLADLNSFGEPYQGGLKLQVTNSTINTFEPYTYVHLRNRSISRDGRYVILQSIAKLDTDPSVSALAAAAFLFDCSTNCLATPSNFRQIGPRFDADPATNGGGLSQPEFTDYNANLAPGGVVFYSRMNFRPDGVVPTNPSEGLNPATPRPHQIFYYSLTAQTNPFMRLTNSQNVEWGIVTRLLATNKKDRVHFVTLKDTAWSAVNLFQLLTPNVTQEDTNSGFHYFTGASGMSISGMPPEALGLAPNMLGGAVFLSQLTPSTAAGFATQALNSRNFVSPLQLKGVSLTIDGISANITGVNNGQINFIVPAGLTAGNKPIVMNNNGIIIRGTVPIIQSPQPDIIRSSGVPSLTLNFSEITPAPHGRARILNVTNPNNPQAEPFTVTTQTPNGTMPTKLRLFLTGVEGVTANSISIQLGSVTVPAASIMTNAVLSEYPGIYTFDFEVPQQLSGAGHVPVVVSIIGGQSSRPLATAPRTRFVSSQATATDLAVWRPNNGTWYILDNNGANQVYVQWGLGTDAPAPGDYDGDGKTDFCVFRPSEGNWYVYTTSNNTLHVVQFGQSGDHIVQADYDGDRKTDVAVFRPSTGYWYILQSSNSQFVAKSLEVTGDKLIPADYDGDGKADLAVWKDSQASFYVKGTIENSLAQTSFGQAGDKPVIGDYDGDGRADFATWRTSDNTWRILNSGNGQLTAVEWGNTAIDVAVPGDYDADGKTDIAVWRSSGSLVGWWTILQSGNSQTRADQWGTTGDIPVPAPW